MAHDWHLSSETLGERLYAIAICQRCGVTRSGLVGTGGAEGHIDLAGTCRPDEPAEAIEPLVAFGA